MTKTLSIIIPVYNEEKTISALLDKILDVEINVSKEIIIVNDGSKDASIKNIYEWKNKNLNQLNDLKLIVLEKVNEGKGSAVSLGIRHSVGDIVIIQDADLEYDPKDYQTCIDPILNGNAKVVYGSRELSRNKFSSPLFYLGGLMVTKWINFLFGSDLTDEPTGYKVFDGKLIRELDFKNKRFGWEPEITGKILKLGYNIVEVPITYDPRSVSEGKKIRFIDGIEAFWEALKSKLLPFKINNIFFLFIVCFFLRLLISLPGLKNPEAMFFRPDSSSYIQPALYIIQTGKYSVSPESLTLSFIRPPGYPLYLACVFFITGINYIMPVILSCFISALTCFFVYLAAKLLGGRSSGILAFIFFTLNITSLSFAPIYLSDTLFTFFCAIHFYFFTRFLITKHLLNLWSGMFFLSLGTMVRIVSMYWIFLCVLLVLFNKKISIKNKILGVTGCLILFYGVQFPWMLRNFHNGAGLHLETNSANIYYYNGAALLSVISNTPAKVIRNELLKATNNEFISNPEKYKNEKDIYDYKMNKLKELIMKHPIEYLKLHFNVAIILPDAATFFEILGMTKSGQNTLDILTRQGFIAAMKNYFGDKMWLLSFISPLLLICLIAYLACFLQVLDWIRLKEYYLLLLFFSFALYYLFLPGPIVMPRYQLPALPFIFTCAALYINKKYLLKKNSFKSYEQKK